jgi:hypothetical protein
MLEKGRRSLIPKELLESENRIIKDALRAFITGQYVDEDGVQVPLMGVLVDIILLLDIERELGGSYG